MEIRIINYKMWSETETLWEILLACIDEVNNTTESIHLRVGWGRSVRGCELSWWSSFSGPNSNRQTLQIDKQKPPLTPLPTKDMRFNFLLMIIERLETSMSCTHHQNDELYPSQFILLKNERWKMATGRGGLGRQNRIKPETMRPESNITRFMAEAIQIQTGKCRKNVFTTMQMQVLE